MINRRRFIAATAAGLMGGASCRRSPEGKTRALTRFVDRLPIPSIATPMRSEGGVPVYEIAMRQFETQIHRDLKPGAAWGCGDPRQSTTTVPGLSFETRRGQPIRVHWRNLLPERHLLPVDHTVNMSASPDVRTVVHLHGSKSHPASDGNPNAWFTPEGPSQQRGPQYARDPKQSEVYEYLNDQRATLLHYHDHAAGITRLNVHAGLAGLYFIRDDFEEALIAGGLPSGPYEVPLVLQDKILSESGCVFFYPSEYEHEEMEGGEGKHFLPMPSPSLVPEFLGDAPVVNGKAWPFMEVEPRQYRFRILNGSSSRFYRVNLIESDPRGETAGRLVSGPAMVQIGNDGGFLPAPAMLDGATNKLLLAPGERADVLVDFSASPGRNYLLWNDAVAPFPLGEPDTILTPLMLFRVQDSRVYTPAPIPGLEPIASLDRAGAVQRDLILHEDLDEYGRMRQRLGTLADGPLFFHDPVTEAPRRGATEVWRLINPTEDSHPIHLHLVHFQVLSRQPLDPMRLPEVVFTGPAEPPAANERGWKDVVRASPGFLTTIAAKFEAPASWVYEGAEYVWHCHMLEHEDHDMMRPFVLR